MCYGLCINKLAKFKVFTAKVIFVILAIICLTVRASDIVNLRKPRQGSYSLGSCKVVIDQPCPYEDINFFLYTRNHPEYPLPIHVGDSIETSNLTSADFNPRLSTKIIIHGYNSDMFVNVLVEIKKQYLLYDSYNVFAVDWEALSPSPCYLSAAYNTRQVGKCTAQLIERLRDLGTTDIHLIGFSLGAHVTNFAANALKPYKLPRITGLDPAMPGFTFVSRENKLNSDDADFVDVIHTNAFVQGQIQPSGHVDFYMNGGVVQPGCWAENRFFACNHHRAPLYFAESITTSLGFWGWPCKNYFMYLIGQCRPKEPQVIAGEHVARTSQGMHLIITNSVAPFAVGKFEGPAIEIIRKSERKQRMRVLQMIKSNRRFKEQLIKENFNNDNDVFNAFINGSYFENEIRVDQIY